MSENAPANPLLDDDEVLRLVRSTRLTALDSQLADGIPTSTDGFEMLNKNLIELEKGAFKSKQQKQEEKSQEAVIAMAKLASEELARKMGINLFTGSSPITVDHTEALEGVAGTATIADGELFIGNDTRTYDEFSSTVGAELDRKRRGIDQEEPTDSP